MYQNLDLNRPVYTLTIGEFIELNKQILSEMLANNWQPIVEVEKSDEILIISQVAELLNLSVPTIYDLVHHRKIPYFKMAGQKRLYFKRSVIFDWLDSGRRKTYREIEKEAEAYLSRKGKSK